MCWLHKATGGHARLPQCNGPPYSRYSNTGGFGPVDYWIDNDIPLWHKLFLEVYVGVLMLFHRKHVHKYEQRPASPGTIEAMEGKHYFRCLGCGQYRDIRGEN